MRSCVSFFVCAVFFAFSVFAEESRSYPWKIEEIKKIDGPLMRQRDVFVLVPHAATNAARLRLVAREVFREIGGEGFDSIFVFLFRKAPMGRQLGAQASYHWTKEKGDVSFVVQGHQWELEQLWLAAGGADGEEP